jgi:hypothetical protein
MSRLDKQTSFPFPFFWLRIHTPFRLSRTSRKVDVQSTLPWTFDIGRMHVWFGFYQDVLAGCEVRDLEG